MTFKEEMKERTEVIEKLLVKYLPKAEGYQSQIMEAMEDSTCRTWSTGKKDWMTLAFAEDAWRWEVTFAWSGRLCCFKSR